MEIKIRHQGADCKAEAELIAGRLWIHFNGRTWDVEADSGKSKKRGRSGAGAASDQVAAPMPGKITKLLVQVGQEIKKGQPVLVMEAMKMEYTLKSDILGRVLELHCAVGDQVVLGRTLVQLAPTKS
jgi:biotin carboxyl carrier protein